MFDFLRNNTLSRAELSESEGHTLNIHYGDILVKFGEVIDANRNALPRIADDGLTERLSCHSLADGDVIIADTAEDEAVGKCSELRGCGSERIVSGLHTMACRPMDEFAQGYLGYYLNSPAFHNQLLPLMQGIKVISVSKGAISDTDVRFPSLPEQHAIGQSLSSLDSLITLHQRKCQYRGLYGYLSWEQRKLGEFGSVAMCKRIYKEQTSEQGDVPFFKIGTFGADPDAFISNELFEDFKRTYPYPTPGTLLISAAGSIGRVVEYQGEKAYFQDSNIVWLEHDRRLNDAFLKPLYSQIEWGLEGSTIKRLYNKDLLSAEVSIPDGREQKEIGQFFAKLDSLITLHQ